MICVSKCQTCSSIAISHGDQTADGPFPAFLGRHVENTLYLKNNNKWQSTPSETDTRFGDFYRRGGGNQTISCPDLRNPSLISWLTQHTHPTEVDTIHIYIFFLKTPGGSNDTLHRELKWKWGVPRGKGGEKERKKERRGVGEKRVTEEERLGEEEKLDGGRESKSVTGC